MRDYYNQWLTNEIGEERQFPWGTIGSFYDAKGGFSSMRDQCFHILRANTSQRRV